ncbi:MAG: cobalt transporter CbiM [Desulfoarculaceae bacterium]|nr:cobalt transporter CbiM [Desulfoarculaceae bacterium]
MHISEGILTGPVLLGGGALTIIGTTIGLRRLNYERIMTVALLASTFFVASLIHVPIGPGSAHLLLGGLMGIILGWAAFPAILTALLLQALFFQYGGLLVLGVNTFNMAAPAVLCGLALRPWLHRGKSRQLSAGFLAGFCSLLLSALLTAAALWLSDPGFSHAAAILVAANVPVMVIEGCITFFIVGFLARVQPEILDFTKSTQC